MQRPSRTARLERFITLINSFFLIKRKYKWMCFFFLFPTEQTSDPPWLLCVFTQNQRHRPDSSKRAPLCRRWSLARSRGLGQTVYRMTELSLVLWPDWGGLISTQPADRFYTDTLIPNGFPDQCGHWFTPAVTRGGFLSLTVNIFQIGFIRLGCERNALSDLICGVETRNKSLF